MRLLLWIPLFCMKNNLIFTSEQWQDHYLHQGLICAILRVFPENLGFEIWSKLFFFFIFRCQIQQGKLQHESVTSVTRYPALVLFQAGRRVKVGGQASCTPAYSHSAVPIAAAFRNRQKPTDLPTGKPAASASAAAPWRPEVSAFRGSGCLVHACHQPGSVPRQEKQFCLTGS